MQHKVMGRQWDGVSGQKKCGNGKSPSSKGVHPDETGSLSCNGGISTQPAARKAKKAEIVIMSLASAVFLSLHFFCSA